MRARSHALGSLRGRKTGAERKAAADALGDRHDIRRDADLLIGKEPAGAAHAGLHFVEHQQQTVLVAQLAQAAQKLRLRATRMPPSPWIGSTRIAAVSGPIARFDRRDIAERRPDRSLRPAARTLRDISCCPPAAMVASVRPWKAPSKVMMR